MTHSRYRNEALLEPLKNSNLNFTIKGLIGIVIHTTGTRIIGTEYSTLKMVDNIEEAVEYINRIVQTTAWLSTSEGG